LIKIHAGINGFVDIVNAETQSGLGGSGLGECGDSDQKADKEHRT
jgi:hypothetical protein